MSAYEVQTLEDISIKTLEKMRNDDSFDPIWDIIKSNTASLDLHVDTIIASIKERFDQPGFKTCLSLDANYGMENQEWLSVPNIYHQDVTEIELEAQLESMETYFDEKEDTTLTDIIEKMY